MIIAPRLDQALLIRSLPPPPERPLVALTQELQIRLHTMPNFGINGFDRIGRNEFRQADERECGHRSS